MANSTGKIIVTLFDNVLKQMNDNDVYTRLVSSDTISPDRMQNASNVYWRTVEQQRKAIAGWDLTGLETGTIEQYYPLSLGTPTNDFMAYRVDDLRDKGFMKRSITASASTLRSNLNKAIADLVASTGSLYYESSSVGYDFVAEADTIMTERQANRDAGSSFFMAPRVSKAMASDLASRDSSLTGINLEAYKRNLINTNIAGFDVWRAPTYGTVAARANATTTTVATDVVEVPRGYTTTGGVNVNVDYRYGTVVLTAGTNYTVGDVITFAGVYALGLKDKTDTRQLMTFKIIAKDTNTITIYPKPIAANQAGITTEQAAYANISTAIVATTVVSKVNATGGQANAFWANDSMEIVSGDAPLEMLNEFDGMKVVSESLDSGVKLYMAYDAALATLNCRVRLFTWYGLCNKDPARNGVAIFAP